MELGSGSPTVIRRWKKNMYNIILTFSSIAKKSEEETVLTSIYIARDPLIFNIKTKSKFLFPPKIINQNSVQHGS